MRNLSILLTVFLWAQSAFGQSYFTNLREGKSRYIGKSQEVLISDILQKHGKKRMREHFLKLLKKKQTGSCASFIIKELAQFEATKIGIDSLSMSMRAMNIIDDIALGILLKRNKIKYKGSFPSMSTASVEASRIQKLFINFRDSLSDGACPEDAYLSLARGLYKEGYDKNVLLKAANKTAKKMKYIDRNEFRMVESFRRAELHKWKLTLGEYKNKLRALRRQIDEYDREESDFVTKKIKKSKSSLRQKLYDNYSYLQILLMGEVLEKMRKRLYSTDISIIIRYADDEQTEVIPLGPTERFRFVLKLLRKEVVKLNQQNIFSNVKANYAVIIAASYEVGTVPAIELEELASLEEIWNPKRTRMQKIMTWARLFGGVASVTMPGAFAFVPVLAVMVIDSFVTDDEPNRDQDMSLF